MAWSGRQHLPSDVGFKILPFYIQMVQMLTMVCANHNFQTRIGFANLHRTVIS